MNALNELQQDFMGWLLHEQPDLANKIEETGKVPRQVRMDIYANAYRLRLLESLQDSFPALHTLLGDDRFEALGFDYIAHQPSHHFSIRYFGHRLADFLTDNTRYPDNALLAEMACFEWAIRDAFDAKDQTPLTFDALTQFPPELWADLAFELHPSTRRIDLSWDVPKLWQAIEEEQPPVEPEKNEYPIGWLIWRHELITHYRSLDVDEAWAIDAALDGASFTMICEGLCEWIDEINAAERAAGFLATWVNEGLVVAVK